MARRTTLRSLVLAGALAAAGTLTGACIVETPPVVLFDTPPPRPRRHAVMPARAGFVWVDGFWVNVGGRWAWRDGHWERGRNGYVYAPGRSVKRAGRWHWAQPRWDRGRARARGEVRVRP